MDAECRYCGNAHDVATLCRPRRVGRRTFLFTMAAAATAVVAAPLLPAGAELPIVNGSGFLTLDMVRRFNEQLAVDARVPRDMLLLMHEGTAVVYNQLVGKDRRYKLGKIVGVITDVGT